MGEGVAHEAPGPCSPLYIIYRKRARERNRKQRETILEVEIAEQTHHGVHCEADPNNSPPDTPSDGRGGRAPPPPNCIRTSASPLSGAFLHHRGREPKEVKGVISNTYIYIYMCMCIYTHMHIHIYTYMHIYITHNMSCHEYYIILYISYDI